MKTEEYTIKKGTVSYRKIFRPVFVVFFLYLTGDAFYRWDGFSFYASFSEFLPSVALVTILWGIVAMFAAFMLWLPGRALEWFGSRAGWRLSAGHWLLFTGIFLILAAATQSVKRLAWHDTPTSTVLKAVVLSGAALLSIFITWKLRNLPGSRRLRRWIGIIQERITPLVWLFGIWLILSVPLVAYHTWLRPEDNAVSQKISPASAAHKNRPNIILVTFDALSALDMSVYGYERPTTPFISRWAETASLFTKVYAESNITTPTTASLMTGKRPWTHRTFQVETASKPLKSNIENMALVLKNNGYYNMAFVSNDSANVKLLGISGSYDIAEPAIELTRPYRFQYIDALLYRLFYGKIKLYNWIFRGDFIFSKVRSVFLRDISETQNPPEIVFESFLKTVKDNYMPFFAWIHLIPPHAPYLPPGPYMGMYDSSPALRRFKSQYRFRGGGPKEFTKDQQPAVDILRARYDEFVTYCDKQFEYFIGQLKRRGLLKNTVVVFSADHGESFEHNFMGHNGPYLFEPLTHIPLIIRETGQGEGRIINDMAEQIDIPATILDLVDIPVPSWMEGRSLVPLMQGERLPARPAFSMALQKNRSRGSRITSGTIAVWEGDYKLIHYLQENKSLLFNLKKDPGELNNLFDSEPETGQHLLALIKDNLEKADETVSRGE